MSKIRKNWLLWSTLIIFLLSSAVVFSATMGYFRDSELVGTIVIFLLLISGIILTVLIANRYKDHKWFIRTSEISIYLLPVSIFLQYLAIDYIHSELINFFIIIAASELMLLAIVNIFIFRDAGETKFVLILLLLIIISFIMLKTSVVKNKLPDFDFLLFIFLDIITGCGMLLFGFRCLFQIEKNSYLKAVAFITCILIAYSSIIFAFKMQSERVAVFEYIYFIPAFILTLIVLFSLPFSNYILWSQLHKRIIKKIMILWFFFFIIFSTSFIFPDLFKKIVFKEQKPAKEFLMYDYELQNKNGLEPD